MSNPLARRAHLVVLAYQVINAMRPSEVPRSDKEILTAFAVEALDQASKAAGPPPTAPRKKPDLPDFLRWHHQHDGKSSAPGD